MSEPKAPHHENLPSAEKIPAKESIPAQRKQAKALHSKILKVIFGIIEKQIKPRDKDQVLEYFQGKQKELDLVIRKLNSTKTRPGVEISGGKEWDIDRQPESKLNLLTNKYIAWIDTKEVPEDEKEAAPEIAPTDPASPALNPQPQPVPTSTSRQPIQEAPAAQSPQPSNKPSPNPENKHPKQGERKTEISPEAKDISILELGNSKKRLEPVFRFFYPSFNDYERRKIGEAIKFIHEIEAHIASPHNNPISNRAINAWRKSIKPIDGEVMKLLIRFENILTEETEKAREKILTQISPQKLVEYGEDRLQLVENAPAESQSTHKSLKTKLLGQAMKAVGQYGLDKINKPTRDQIIIVRDYIRRKGIEIIHTHIKRTGKKSSRKAEIIPDDEKNAVNTIAERTARTEELLKTVEYDALERKLEDVEDFLTENPNLETEAPEDYKELSQISRALDRALGYADIKNATNPSEAEKAVPLHFVQIERLERFLAPNATEISRAVKILEDWRTNSPAETTEDDTEHPDEEELSPTPTPTPTLEALSENLNASESTPESEEKQKEYIRTLLREIGISYIEFQTIKDFEYIKDDLARQAFILKNLKAIKNVRVKNEAEILHEAEVARKRNFLTKSIKNFGRSKRISKKEEGLKSKFKFDDLRQDAENLINISSAGPRLKLEETSEKEQKTGSEKYKVITEYINEEYIEEGGVPRELAEKFNHAATEFSEIPPKRDFVLLSPLQRFRYHQIEKRYNEARSEFLNFLCGITKVERVTKSSIDGIQKDVHKASEGMLVLNMLDLSVDMYKRQIHNPEAEAELRKIQKGDTFLKTGLSSAWKGAVAGKVAEGGIRWQTKAALFGYGSATALGAVGGIAGGILASSIVGGAFGAWRGKNMVQNARLKRDIDIREGRIAPTHNKIESVRKREVTSDKYYSKFKGSGNPEKNRGLLEKLQLSREKLEQATASGDSDKIKDCADSLRARIFFTSEKLRKGEVIFENKDEANFSEYLILQEIEASKIVDHIADKAPILKGFRAKGSKKEKRSRIEALYKLLQHDEKEIQEKRSKESWAGIKVGALKGLKVGAIGGVAGYSLATLGEFAIERLPLIKKIYGAVFAQKLEDQIMDTVKSNAAHQAFETNIRAEAGISPTASPSASPSASPFVSPTVSPTASPNATAYIERPRVTFPQNSAPIATPTPNAIQSETSPTRIRVRPTLEAGSSQIRPTSGSIRPSPFTDENPFGDRKVVRVEKLDVKVSPTPSPDTSSPKMSNPESWNNIKIGEGDIKSHFGTRQYRKLSSFYEEAAKEAKEKAAQEASKAAAEVASASTSSTPIPNPTPEATPEIKEAVTPTPKNIDVSPTNKTESDFDYSSESKWANGEFVKGELEKPGKPFKYEGMKLKTPRAFRVVEAMPSPTISPSPIRTPETTPLPSATPEIIPKIIIPETQPQPSPSPTAIPVSSPEIIPSSTPIPTPEPTPELTPTPKPSPTPQIEPTKIPNIEKATPSSSTPTPEKPTGIPAVEPEISDTVDALGIIDVENKSNKFVSLFAEKYDLSENTAKKLTGFKVKEPMRIFDAFSKILAQDPKYAELNYDDNKLAITDAFVKIFVEGGGLEKMNLQDVGFDGKIPTDRIVDITPNIVGDKNPFAEAVQNVNKVDPERRSLLARLSSENNKRIMEKLELKAKTGPISFESLKEAINEDQIDLKGRKIKTKPQGE